MSNRFGVTPTQLHELAETTHAITYALSVPTGYRVQSVRLVPQDEDDEKPVVDLAYDEDSHEMVVLIAEPEDE